MRYAYINGIILDGSEDMRPLADHVIVTDGEKIAEIVESSKAQLAGCQIVNLKGAYIMPGLINLHVHLPASGKPKEKPSDNVKLVKTMTSNFVMRKILQTLCEGYAKAELNSGVTTIRTVGGVEGYDSIIRDRISTGKIHGPRILASNMAISVAGGHMAGSLAYIANNADEAAEYVRKIAETGPDLIKLMITGGVLDAKAKGEPGELKMPAEYVKAAADQAHQLGLKVAAHVESPEGVKVALENGVDTIEHGAEPDDEIISLFKSKGACHVATIIPTMSFAFMSPEITGATEMEQYNGKVVFDGITDCAKKCLENGIPVGLGTDTGCPFVTHSQMWRELQLFHKHCGVSESFALHTATLINARIAQIDNITGSIEEGKCADFLVTKENPLENLRNLATPLMVVARGEIIEKPKNKKAEAIEKELDKVM